MQFCRLEICADHLRAGGQRCFYPWLAVQTQCRRFARHEARADHHVRVGRVGARRDRRDHDLARVHCIVFAFDCDFLVHRAFERFFHFAFERGLGVRQRDEVLWPFGPGNRRDDGAHIKVQRVGVDRGVIVAAPHAVVFGVGFDQCDAVFVAACVAQVAQSFRVDREEAAGRAVFGRHVGNRGPVGQWQTV